MVRVWKRVSATLASTGVVASFVAACSAGDATIAPAAGPTGAVDGASPGVTSGVPCDVDAVLEANCRKCHGAAPSFGAPMPLVTLSDLRAPSKRTPGKLVYEVIGTRIHDEAFPMPPPPNARLAGGDLAVLDAWIAAGAKPAAEGCGTAAPPTAKPGGPDPLGCSPDQLLRPASKFAVTSATDDVVCYGFDTQAAAKRHVIAGAPRIDNTKVVHHVLLFQADESVSSTPHACGGGSAGWRLVTGWAPGGKNFEMPPEAGFAEETGTTHWVVQIHYNNAAGYVGELDATGYDLCSTTELRANDADILATGTVGITLPPRATTTTTCNVTVPAAFGAVKVVSSWAHMHRLGRAQSVTRLRGGAPATVLDAPNYDFNTGAGASAVDVDVAPGDTLRTSCTWTNTTSDTVRFGEGTADEMCFAFLTYYPKIRTTGFRWSTPAGPLLSKCGTTP